MEWNNGACDGWVKPNNGDVYPIGYYEQRDLAFLGKAAPAWTMCDRYFASMLGPTFPNRIYLHSGVTDRLDDSFNRVDLPTIWDRLAAKKIPARYYCGNVSFLILWNNKYAPITKTHSQFFADARKGTLPAVSFIDPNLTFVDDGPGIGDLERRPSARRHPRRRVLPLDDLQRSDQEPAVVAHAARRHVRRVGRLLRPRAAADREGRRPALRAARLPRAVLLVSPFARRGAVAHGTYDHTSILRMIEWRWGLKPLSVRDANSANLATALDFSRRNLAARPIAVPRLVAGAACPVT